MSHQLHNPNTALYMQAAVSYSLLKLENGSIQIKTRPMKFFEEKLSENGWCRIHKSFMVNPLYVQRITNDRNGIQLHNGQVLPISRRNKKEVLKWRSNQF
jgi:two-component system, LytTR family, response regulator